LGWGGGGWVAEAAILDRGNSVAHDFSLAQRAKPGRGSREPGALELLRRASAVLTAPLAGTMICEPKVLLPASSVSKRRRRTSMCSRAT
jgi:hypothetical protein